MMAYFAEVHRKLSHGVDKMPRQPVPPRLLGRQGWRAAQPGVRRGHFQLDDDEAFVIDVNDGGAGYFTVPISNVWGTTMGIVDARAASTRRSPSPTPTAPGPTCISPRRPRRAQLGRPGGLTEGILTLRMAEFREASARRGPRRARAGGEAGPTSKGARPAPRDRPGRATELADRRAAYLRRLPEDD